MNLLNDEYIIKEGSANFKKSAMNAVGGKLYLTNKRLAFEAHSFNFGGKTKVDLDLRQLVRCQSGKTMLISGEIEVFDKYNHSYTFVVYERKKWADNIENSIIELRDSTYSKVESHFEKKSPNLNDKVSKLKDLKELLDMGLINEEEFNAKKSEILKDF